MAIMKAPSRLYRFNLFGYSFLIWKANKLHHDTINRGVLNGSCKIVRYNEHVALAMPDGTIIPHQIDLDISSHVNAAVTAQLELYVTIDEQTGK